MKKKPFFDRKKHIVEMVQRDINKASYARFVYDLIFYSTKNKRIKKKWRDWQDRLNELYMTLDTNILKLYEANDIKALAEVFRKNAKHVMVMTRKLKLRVCNHTGVHGVIDYTALAEQYLESYKASSEF